MDRLTEIYLTRGVYGNAESDLKQSEAIREQELGPEHPDVAEALKKHAASLRKQNREAAAAERENRAEEIREKLEQPAHRVAPSLF